MAERTRETILVVDDELGPRESLRMILRPTYEVVAGGRRRARRSRSCAPSRSTS